MNLYQNLAEIPAFPVEVDGCLIRRRSDTSLEVVSAGGEYFLLTFNLRDLSIDVICPAFHPLSMDD